MYSQITDTWHWNDWSDAMNNVFQELMLYTKENPVEEFRCSYKNKKPWLT